MKSSLSLKSNLILDVNLDFNKSIFFSSFAEIITKSFKEKFLLLNLIKSNLFATGIKICFLYKSCNFLISALTLIKLSRISNK